MILTNRMIVFAESNAILVQPVNNIEQNNPNMTDTIYMNNAHTSRSFKLDESGIIKVIVRTDKANRTGRIWVSTDAKGLNIIGTMSSIQQIGSSGSGTFGITGAEMMRYLEGGTYYLNYNGDQESGDVYTAILFESAKEMQGNPVWIKQRESMNGFLSEMIQKDKFAFKLTKKSNVTITINKENPYEKVTIENYNSGEMQEIKSENSREHKKVLKLILDAGTYLIHVDAKESYFGKYTLQVETEPVYLNLSTSNRPTRTATIKVSCSSHTTLMWAKGKYNLEDFDDGTIWTNTYEMDEKGNQIYIDHAIRDGKFVVKENGYYSVKLQDKEGNRLVKTIKISNIDRKAPIINVKNGKTYKLGYTIRISDKNGLKSTTLNGKKTKTAYRIIKEGTYKINAIDKVGNVKTVTIKIKK